MKIGIIGLGLIGGSLGLDLTAKNYHVVGVSRNPKTCSKALQKGVATKSGVDLSLLKDCDVVVIATPIEYIIPTLKSLLQYLSSHTVVTDVGSVKESIVREAQKICPNFVGSHPMAGTANSGIDAVERNLFNNAPCVITPNDYTRVRAIALIEKMWLSVGCKILTTSPEIHDQAVAWISHLPVMISANLIYSCLGEKDQKVREFAKKIASSGFKDTSRVGGGNPELGLMMAKNNQKNILNSLKKYRQNLDTIINDIESNHWQEIEQLLTITQSKRSDFL
ncbi:prephenate/arogenate dehydrogenase [Cyanobacterium stanieri LEGE 03274]|uniref:Prephenate/arogenate dehydrogenase n=1 Tax=Cyanobacterium stanieri LEGE 03274 TaxID=1828756 RepID=A0ABR9V0P8_9CHRO|nr:prephenate/arogenate dehydrogenase [Cyanobacterium stanieri]MBE9221458.1 prephenate/arogenate dehydrogenase [Cyanobacterium stanieri LEGE 03274]